MARRRRPAPLPEEDRAERFKNPTSGFLLLSTPPEYVGNPEYPQVGETLEDFVNRREHELEVLDRLLKERGLPPRKTEEVPRARGD